MSSTVPESTMSDKHPPLSPTKSITTWNARAASQSSVKSSGTQVHHESSPEDDAMSYVQRETGKMMVEWGRLTLEHLESSDDSTKDKSDLMNSKVMRTVNAGAKGYEAGQYVTVLPGPPEEATTKKKSWKEKLASKLKSKWSKAIQKIT